MTPAERARLGDDRQAALAALMEWYAAMGVDGVVGERPFDWLAAPVPERGPAAGAPEADRAASSETERSGGDPSGGRAGAGQRSAPLPPGGPARGREALPAAPAASVMVPGAATVPDDMAVANARALAAGAATLEELHAILAGFDGCNLKKTATRLVFADGNPAARLMLVGEAPGREEDIAGLPFVGRSGRLLDRMLAAIGLDRSGVYIANVVPWRPPGNRTPSPQETEICKPFIARQIELVSPDILVFLGGASAKALTGSSDGILKLRGRWMDYTGAGHPIRAMATLHPAYLLRQPAQKRLVWRDFLAIRAALAGGAAPR